MFILSFATQNINEYYFLKFALKTPLGCVATSATGLPSTISNFIE
jgi:hypothetical protein